jgi:hypothetical protein
MLCFPLDARIPGSSGLSRERLIEETSFFQDDAREMRRGLVEDVRRGARANRLSP